MVEAFLKYIQFEKRYSEHTLTAYKKDLAQFLTYLNDTYEMQEEDLGMINHSIVRSWILELMEGGITPRSINRKIACLKSFFKYHVRVKNIQVNPMQRIVSLKTSKKIPEFVEESSIVKLLDHFEFESTFEGQRDRLIIEFLYSTGMRLSELLGIEEKDINLHDKKVKVLGKGNKERILPIPHNLILTIQDYLAHKKDEINCNLSNRLIVTNKGKDGYPGLVYRTVKNYLGKITTIEKRSPHVLRHTFATHLLNKGADLNAVKELLGHASLAATQVYTHNSIEKIRKAFEQAHPRA